MHPINSRKDNNKQHQNTQALHKYFTKSSIILQTKWFTYIGLSNKKLTNQTHFQTETCDTSKFQADT